jgi:hypothetical protein
LLVFACFWVWWLFYILWIDFLENVEKFENFWIDFLVFFVVRRDNLVWIWVWHLDVHLTGWSVRISGV